MHFRISSSVMEQVRSYQRGLYRLPVTYPVMYCIVSTVGEGMITNLSALGCTIETSEPLPMDRGVALRLLLPDRHESLPIKLAHIRWVKGNRAGIEFTQMDRTANLRLHSFVWDRMVERIQTIQQSRTTS
ncbi:MAG TPA: PilZ domain-containing protein [Nitrospira sp.]